MYAPEAGISVWTCTVRCPFIDVVSEPADALYKPSVNVLMESAGNSMGRRVVGVTMTGMGSDGVEGSRILKEKGGYLIAQNEASCVVYGMPKAVVDAGLADEARRRGFPRSQYSGRFISLRRMPPVRRASYE